MKHKVFGFSCILALFSCTQVPENNVEQWASSPHSLITTQAATTEQCLNGGVLIFVGIDANENQILDELEVESTSIICNGLNGSNGVDGTNGTDGVDGVNGSDGADGNDGSGLLWRGNWQAANSYAAQDLVRFGSGVYIARQVPNSSESPDISADWDQFAQDGEQATGVGQIMNWRGDWLVSTSYQTYDLVRFGTSLFISLVELPTSQPGDNAAQWQLFLSDGVNGSDAPLGSGLTWQGTWSTGVAYVNDDLVRYGSSLYIALASHDSIEPGSDESIWQLFIKDGIDGSTGPAGTGLTWRGDWSASEHYAVNDIVRLSGAVYLALLESVNATPSDPSSNYWALMVEDGAAGEAGLSGAGATMVEIDVEPPGSQCSWGGTRITLYEDANGNGLFDSGESSSSDYVCEQMSCSLSDNGDGTSSYSCADGSTTLLLNGDSLQTTRRISCQASLSEPADHHLIYNRDDFSGGLSFLTLYMLTGQTQLGNHEILTTQDGAGYEVGAIRLFYDFLGSAPNYGFFRTYLGEAQTFSLGEAQGFAADEIVFIVEYNDQDLPDASQVTRSVFRAYTGDSPSCSLSLY